MDKNAAQLFELENQVDEQTIHELLQRQIIDQAQKVQQVYFVFSSVISTVLILSALGIVLTLITTLFLLFFPEESAKLISATNKPTRVVFTASVPVQTQVLGASTEQEQKQKTVSLLGLLFKPFASVSLELVKQIDSEKYSEIVQNSDSPYYLVDQNGQQIVINGLKATGNQITNPTVLQFSEPTLIKNLNAEFLNGKIVGTNPGDIVAFSDQNTIPTLRLTSDNIENITITNEYIATNSINSINLIDGAITADKIATAAITVDKIASGVLVNLVADNEVTAAKIKDGEVGTSEIADGAVTSDKISDGTISANDLSSTLQLSSSGFIDLSLITHSSTTLQGFRLPQTSSTPTNPQSGEGYIAYDKDNNQVIYFDGTSWAGVGSGDITAVSAGNGLSGGASSGAASLEILLTTSGSTGSTASNSGLEISSSGITLLKGCNDNQILKYSDAGGWQCANDLSGGGGSATLQDAYSNATNPEIVLSSSPGGVSIRDASTTIGGNLFEVQNNAASSTFFAVTTSGIAVTGAATISNSLTVSSGTINFPAGQIDNTELANSSITITPGAGLSGGGSVSLGGTSNFALDQTYSPTWTGVHTFQGNVLISDSGADTITIGNSSDTLSISSTGLNVNSSGTVTGATIAAGSNTISGLTTTNFTSANISQWTNDSGYITDGNTNWNNSYGFITDTSTDTLTNKTIAAGSNTISGLTTSNFSSANISQWTNNAGYLTANQSISLTGAVTGSGTTSIATTLADDAVTSTKIADGAITLAKIGQNGCGNNQIIKWNGSAWACANDATSAGGGTVTLNPSASDAASGTDPGIWINHGGSGNLLRLQNGGGTPVDRFIVSNSGVITTGSYQATAIDDAYISDTLTIGAGGSVAAAAISGTLSDAQIADTLTASIFIGSGSTTNAVDLATAEVAGTLADGNVADNITISNSGSVDSAALTGTVNTARISGSYTGITGVGTLTAGATGAGFTLNFGTSTLSGNITGTNIDESSLAGLTTSNFTSAAISQWTNDSGFITDGNTNWNNSYGFITDTSTDTLTNKTIAAGSNTISGLTTTNFSSANISQWTNNAGYITDGNSSWDNSYGFITASSSDTLTNKTFDANGTGNSISNIDNADLTDDTLNFDKMASSLVLDEATTITASGALNYNIGNNVTLTTSGSGSIIATNLVAGSSVVSNAEVDDDLTISSSGSVAWTALASYPTACSGGEAVTAVGDTLTCASFLTAEADTLNAVTGRGATTANAITLTTAGAALTLKPGSAPAANTVIFDIQLTGVGGTIFSVDYEGDIVANSLDLTTALADSEVSDTITVGSGGSVAAAAISGTLSDAQIADTLTASIFIGSGSTTNAVDLGTAEVSGTLGDANISDTLTSSIFIGSGSTTNAIDLATAEVAGTLADGNISDTLTIGASSTINAGALPADGYAATYVNVGESPTSSDIGGSFSGGLTIGADRVTETMLKVVDSANDEECLTYETTTGDFEWQSCGAGAPTWGSITGTLSNQTDLQTALDGKADDATTLSGYGITDALSNASNSTQSGYFGNILLQDDTNPSHYLTITAGSDLSSGRTLTLITGDASRTVTINGDTTLSGTNTGDQTITLTSDITGSGTGSFAATIADNAVDGTDISLSSEAQGDIMYFDGTDWVRVAGSNGNFLKSSGTGVSWSGVTATDVGLGSVENTALSTWAGSTNITTLGTIATGTWNGTAIADTYVADNITIGATGSVDVGALSGSISDSQVSNTLTSSIFIGSGSSTNAVDLGTAEIAGTLADGNVADNITISSSGTVDWTALSSYPSACGAGEAVTTIGDTLTCTAFLTAESDTLNAVTGRGASTANAITLTTAGTALTLKPGSAPAANTKILDIQATGGGSTVFSVDYEGDVVANSLTVSTALTDAQVSDTLTASIFIGSGSTTNAVDLATAEVNGSLGDGNVSDTLTIGAASTIAAGALPADGYAATYVNVGESPTSSDIGGSFSGGLTIGNDRITEAMLKVVDSANDEECLTYETTTGDFEWQSCGSSTALSPWTSDIDADGYDLTDLSNIEFRDTTSAPAGSVISLFSDNTGDLTANVLTGKTLNISINGSDEYNFSATEFALNSNSINTGTATLSTAELNRLDGKDAALVDTNDAVTTAITGTGTLTAGSTGAGFTLNFGTSTLSGSITGTNIDESSLAGLTTSNFTSANISQWTNDSGYITDGNTGWENSYGFLTSVDVSSNTNLSATNGITLSGDALSLDVTYSPTWTSAHTFSLAETEDLEIDIAISGTNSGQGLLTTLTNSSASGNQYGIYVDNAASSGTTESLLVLDNSDADTAVTNGIQFVNAGGGITNLFDVFGTLISSSEFTILDSGIAISELTDSGTFTAGTVDINGGAIDGTAIGANSASTGAFTTLSSTGVSTIGNNSATVAINSSDWDIDVTGAITGVSFDANGSGNSISNIDNADLTNDTLNFDKISATLTLDEETTISAGGALNLLIGNNVTLTTSGSGSIIATTLVAGSSVVSNAEVDDDLTISSSGSVTWSALTSYPTGCSGGEAVTTIGDTLTCGTFLTAEADTLNSVTGRGATTANAITLTTAGTALLFKPGSAPSANTLILDLQQTGGGSTVFSVDYEGDVVANSLSLSTALTDAQVADTLTASIFIGSGSTTNAVDLATAEVNGTLADGNVSDTLTIGAASTIASGALPADGYAATYVNVGESPTASDIGGSFSGGLTIGNDRVTEAMLKAVDTANDEECLTYETTTGDFEWQSCGSSLTPWTADIDADGYDLTDLSNIEFRDTTGAPAGTVVALFRDNTGDLTANVLSGKTLNVSVAGSDEFNFSASEFSLNSNSINTGSTTLSTAELDRLDGINAALVDTNDAVSTAITGTGTLTAGSTGAGFTLNFGTSTLSGNIGGGNIDEATLSGIDISGSTNLSASSGITLTDDALTLDVAFAPTWTAAHTFNLAETEDLQIDIAISGTNSGQGILTTLTNSSASGNQYGVYIDNAASSGTTESLLVLDNSDSDTAVSNGIQFVNAGGGITNLFDVFGTQISSSEFTILDSGIAVSELTDSGTFTAGTVDINGGAIDGTAIGANSASTGAFTTLSSTGVSTIGNNSATVAINSSDWDIDVTGAITGVSLDANGSGNSISNIDNGDLTNDTLDFDKISASLTLDEETTIAAGGALNLLIGNNVTLTTTGSGSIIATDLNCTNCIGATEISDLALGTDTSGNYVTSVATGTGLSGGAAGSEGATLSLSIDQATAFTWTGQQSWTTTVTAAGSIADINLTLGDDGDADIVSGLTLDVTSAATGDADTVYALNIGNVTNEANVLEYAIRIGSGWQEIFNINGTLLSATELGLLDGKTTLVDTDDAVATAITGVGTITAGVWNADAIADTYISDTLTASIFVGSGSTTDAVDLATAEVAGTLADGNVSDTLTIGAASTIAAGALPADGYAATYVNVGESPTSADIGGSFSGGLTIGNDRVVEAMLDAVDTANDEECLTYESTDDDFEWQSCGGSSDLDSIYDADSDKVLGIDSVTGLIFNMTTTGNLVIQDNGNTIATFANDGIITFDPGATAAGSDFIISQRAGTNTQITATAIPTVDMFSITNAGQGITTTSGVDAFSVNYVQSTDGTTITGSGIDISLTQSGDAADTIRAITINNITQGSSIEEGLFIGTGFDRALMIEGGTAGSGLVEFGSDQTQGLIFEIGAPSAVTLDGTLTGTSIDLATNYTVTNQSFIGLDLLLGGGTNTSGTVTIDGIDISGTSLVQTTGGSTTFNGVDVTTPAITQTAGTVAANGIRVITGNITTQGTQSGVSIDLSASDIATNGVLNGLNIAGRSSETVGTISGINIGNITAGTATERGISIGSGWDGNLVFLDTTAQIQISNGGAYTFEDTSGNDSMIIRDVSAATDHVITIDSDTQFTFDSANDTDVDITTNTNEALRIQANGSGDIIFDGDSDSDFQITDGTNSYTFNVNSGPVYAGTARPTKRITLSPEYQGAVLTPYYGAGTDTSTTGDMTSDTDTSQGTSIRNYYQWERTTDATQHYYTVAVRVTLPKDFSAWTTSNALQISYQTESATDTESDLDVRLYNENDAAVVSSSTDNASTSWTTVTIDDATLDDGAGSEWDAADETAVIYLRMGSGNSQYVRVGDITLNYLAQF